MLKKYKKILAIILSLVTICMCFTGCGGEAEVVSPEEKMLIEGTLLHPSQNENFKFNVYSSYVEITQYIGESTDVVIPDTLADKPVLSIIEKCFEYNDKITSVTIADSVIRIGGSAFASCTSLTKLVLPNKIKSIPGGLCNGCTSLTDVNIPSSVMTICGSAFANCSAFKKIVIPRTITYLEDGAFSGCENVEEIIIYDGGFVENGVLVKMNNLKVGSGAFAWCTSLKKVVVPASVKEIESDAFMGVGEDAMFYGYVPSSFATICANIDNKYKFTPIQKDDEIDKMIRTPYTQVQEGVTPSVS